MKKLLIILTVVFVAVSCNILDCEQKDKLFASDFHTYQIELEDDINVDTLLNKMINRYCVNKTEGDLPFIFYDIKNQKFVGKSSSKTLKIGIEPPLCFKAEYDLTQILEIVKEHNNYRVEGEITNIENISDIVEEHYYKSEIDDNLASSELKGIWIILERKEGINDAAEIILEIIDGFQKTADKFSNEEFDKPFCDLNEEELKVITDKFVFRLSYKYYETEADVMLKNSMF